MEIDRLETAERIVDILPGLAVDLHLAALLDQSDNELTPHQLLALFLVRESEDLTVRTGDLADLLGISRPSGTALADRLVGGGFLQRDRGADRRVVLLTLSRKGRSLIETLATGLVDRIAAVLGSMDNLARARLEMALSEVATFARRVGRDDAPLARRRSPA
jgi:DNA-binding MarR family transcriptional regulator